MSVTGTPPRCETCQSLERHRAIRAFFNALVSPELKALRVLQFSSDRAVKPEWFGHFEVSVYGGKNSLDLQDIDRPDDDYDIVICNHVLEHVADDGAALNELVRIMKPGGFLFLTVPDPARRATTSDWGYPDDSQHGHYRIYGADIIERFAQHAPDAMIEQATLRDTATDTPDVAFIFSKTSGNRPIDHVRNRVDEMKPIQPVATA